MLSLRTLFLVALSLTACTDGGWSSRFTQTDQLYKAQRATLAPMVFLDAKPDRPFHAVGYFELTSPENGQGLTLQSFKARAATTGRDLGCEVVILADVMQSSILAPDNRLLACGNCQDDSGVAHEPYAGRTKKFYCGIYDVAP